ncbi:class I SAM-dependent methyltransferase [bacterium]|nr:MAG: class I SAM-dependent methyltransferase [bacterium]
MTVRLLDPRTFPVELIASLVHALPPTGVALEVADLPGGSEAVEWLNAHGRSARLVPAPEVPHQTRLWEPSPGLKAFLQVSPPPQPPLRDEPLEEGALRALDLACGTGRDAVWLAMHGWRVTAVDILPDALDRAQALAELHDVTLDLRCLDVTRDPLPKGPFDLVCAFRYLPPLDLMASVLAPGGTLLVETFTDRERDRTGKPRDVSLVLPSAGPPDLPKGMVLLDYRIASYNGRELATLSSRAETNQKILPEEGHF